ncbi:MAG: RNase H-like domain-containing protein [Candidatus Thiodiazotropha endolucinida]|nr:DDE-type integrase/transposase/recombinase [Candidatus Thiodiazotropha taylori]MCW4343545.1 RNase H-like domain-containing protein [Candidatus Thiodiazotropha endolucinida]
MKQRVPKSDGVYVEGCVENVKLLFTADTGASKTLLSKRVYDKIPERLRPSLSKSVSLVGASGRPLKEYGKAIFNLKMGDLCLRAEIVVADIADDGLLGVDILQKQQSGPADILLSKGEIHLNGHTIPCIQVGMSQVSRRVTSADHYLIHGRCEQIIDVFIERRVTDYYQESCELVIEPSAEFIETYPLLMTSTVVDINSSASQKVRILNPFDEDISIRQDCTLGYAEPYTAIKTIMEMEDKREVDNLCSIRRIECHNDFCPYEENEILTSPKVEVGEHSFPTIPSHLEELYSEASSGRDRKEKMIIAQLLVKYQDVFSKHEYDLGFSNLGEHIIDTGNAKPIKQRPRRVPLALTDQEEKVIRQMEEQKIIRKSNSPWASPLCLVLKPNGKVRPCVDYRAVNKVTKPDSYPIPNTRDCLDAFAGAKLFSVLDLRFGYFQIPVAERDIPKTAFVSKYGLYEHVTMPMGMMNSGATFQRVMERALMGLQWFICLIYLDDVCVFGKNFDEHISRVDKVLARLKETGLKLGPDKCHLLKTEVTFLGHVVSERGVLPNPNNVAKILRFPIPTTPTQVKQILGLGSYYRRFIKSYSDRMRPLIDLTKKGKVFIWTDACQRAFDDLKMALTGPEVMAFPQNEGEYILDCDASNIGISGVLSQMQNGEERVISYGSRTLSKSERNYCVTDRELLAVRYFVEYYRQYLLGRKFTVRSDHQALVWICSFREPKGRICRFLEILSAYCFTIEYRKGGKHINADVMSRCFDPWDCKCSDVDTMEPLKCGPCKRCKKRAIEMQGSNLWNYKLGENPVLEEETDEKQVCNPPCLDKDPLSKLPSGELEEMAPNLVTEVRETRSASAGKNQSDDLPGITFSESVLSKSQMKKLQENDPNIGPVYKWYSNGNRPHGNEATRQSPETRYYWILWDSLRLVEGLLYKEFQKKDGTGKYLQFIVPKGLRPEIMRQMHDSLQGGHLGQKKTRERIQQRYFWFEMKIDINNWVLKCDTCAANKLPVHKPRAPLGHMKVGGVFDRLSVDMLGPLIETPRSNRYILVATCHFSKWVEIFALPDQTAKTCARTLLNEVFARYGICNMLLSDQGRNFESSIFQELCQMLEIKKSRTSVRNPRCNGQTERFNKTLIRMIKAYLKDEQTDWDLNLGCLAAAYRSTPNESTQLTPNLLMLGREVRLPAELLHGDTIGSRDEITSYGDYVDQLRDRMQTAHQVARKNIGKAASVQKDRYDVNVYQTAYAPGDFVWYLSEVSKPGRCPKLEPTYAGPYVVVCKLNPLNFQVQFDKHGTSRIVHHNKLKKYEGNQAPPWAVKVSKSVRPVHQP